METGAGVLVVDDDEGNLLLVRRIMPAVATCGHDAGIAMISRGRFREVLVSADGGMVANAFAATFAAAKENVGYVGVLSADEQLPAEITDKFFAINVTVAFFSNGEEGTFLTDRGGKDWRKFLSALLGKKLSIMVMPVPLE